MNAIDETVTDRLCLLHRVEGLGAIRPLPVRIARCKGKRVVVHRGERRGELTIVSRDDVYTVYDPAIKRTRQLTHIERALLFALYFAETERENLKSVLDAIAEMVPPPYTTDGPVTIHHLPTT